MPRYLFLGYADTATERAMTPAELDAVIDAHSAFAAEMRAEGRLHAGAGLADPKTATTVRRTPAGTPDVVTDGPFTELAEQIGGLYILECADREEALALARRIPYSATLTVEVREVVA
ncbi:hypothetical protein Afil01_11850 [Actinorhabdospora filicis]|uniref:YCII-related domain-containing protein n=1 Tax=Actinorhabdospora filicis TaxID=1785913 RepID=A0A9W6SI21_9ACTN|nr:YciI family protein [Actinorhabdospora filicis]GLZ76378.1 hypothetical protein Afil01_11850 [Actinorhabdospora filicis]